MSLAHTGMEGLGPRGGNLNNPVQQPEARRSEFKGLDLGGGALELHRFKKPDSAMQGLQKEQVWHRMAAYMLLAGKSNKEIAAAAEVTPQTVSILRGQQWFTELLSKLATESGTSILGLIQAECVASVQKIVQIRDESENERLQLSAAQILLEHAQGKPTQKILSATTNVPYTSPTEEMNDILTQLNNLRAKREQLPEPKAEVNAPSTPKAEVNETVQKPDNGGEAK